MRIGTVRSGWETMRTSATEFVATRSDFAIRSPSILSDSVVPSSMTLPRHFRTEDNNHLHTIARGERQP